MQAKPTPLEIEERAVVNARARSGTAKKWTVHALTVKPTHVHVLATLLPATRDQ